MGRAPCCDKANVKKGPWSPEEDATLKSYIDLNGTGGNWIALPQKIGLKRCGKSCRLRWLNYLRPNIKHGGFSEEEDNLICSLYISIGSRWSIIAAQLPGRTDNDIKNYWNTRLKKKLLGKQRKELQARRGNNSMKQGSLIVSETTHNPYWRPEIPPSVSLPQANQEPGFTDHTSIRKLLIKLGGKFSEDDGQIINGGTDFHEFPIDISSSQQFYQQSINQPSSLDALNNIQFTQMLQGEVSFLPELQEMVYRNNQRLDGRVDFLYGEDMMSTRIGTTFGENISWGETSSPVTQLPNYKAIQAGALHDSVCNDLDLPLYGIKSMEDSGRDSVFHGLRYNGVQ